MGDFRKAQPSQPLRDIVGKRNFVAYGAGGQGRTEEDSDPGPWQKKHFRALESAYANSPYYLYYIDEIMSFFQNREKFIIDLNMKILETLFSILGWNKSPALSEDYVFEPDNIADYREGSSVSHREIIPGILPAYRQTFGEKFSFVPDLSILDMLFNLGPDTDGFLE